MKKTENLKLTKKEIKTIEEDVWATLDAAQCKARSIEELINLQPKEFELYANEVRIRQKILKKIIYGE